jgi:hypothetical protein
MLPFDRRRYGVSRRVAQRFGAPAASSASAVAIGK